jgi:hypothetical protein
MLYSSMPHGGAVTALSPLDYVYSFTNSQQYNCSCLLTLTVP